jgi:hypothetical protein
MPGGQGVAGSNPVVPTVVVSPLCWLTPSSAGFLYSRAVASMIYTADRLGPIWDPELFREQFRRVAHRLPVGVQVPLRRRQRPVASDLPQVVERHAVIRHPGQPGVPQIVASEVLVAELGHGFVPVGCIAKHRGGYPASTRPSEETGIRATVHRVEAAFDQLVDLCDQRNNSSAFAFRALIDEPARRRSGLSTYRPLPRGCVNVADADTGDLADSGGSDRTEYDDVAPTRVVIR